MSFILQPWQVVFVAMSGWVNQRQQQVIEFQNAEIEALLKKLGKKRGNYSAARMLAGSLGGWWKVDWMPARMRQSFLRSVET